MTQLKTGEIHMTLAINLNTTVNESEVTKHEETKHFKVYVNFIGIKKKCRKSDRHSLKVTYIDYNDGIVDYDSLNILVASFLLTNVKSIDSRYHVTVTLDYVSRSYDRGFQTELWQPFSKLNQRYQLPTSLYDSLSM
jgi:hypothetical protein